METAEGVIASLRKDRKGLKFENGEWYSNAFLPELTCEVGDKVKIEYTLNITQTGEFKNYSSVEVLEKAAVKATNQVSSDNKFDPSTMILSYVKDISVSNGKSMMDNVMDVLLAYEMIKMTIDNPGTLSQSEKKPEEFAGAKVEEKK